MKNGGRRFRPVLGSILLLAVLAITAELLLRLFLPLHFVSSNAVYRYDSELGFAAKPGHTLVLKDYQQEMYVNKLGTINFQEHFGGYRYLVFALGDSYTQGTGLYADASYPFQLDLLLNIDEDGVYRKKYGIVNLGLSAFGGEQSLLALKRYIRILGKPSIVLYLGCENDYSDDLWFKAGAAHKSIVEGSPYWGIWYYPVKWIFVDTEIGKRVKLLVSMKRAGAIRHSRAVSETPRPGNTDGDEMGRAAALEMDVIRRIIDTAGENGGQVVLSWTHDTPSYRFLKSWAHQSGLSFADWVPGRKSVLQAVPALRAVNPHSGGHYRTWVNQLIAREYAKHIKKILPDPS